MRSVSKHDFSYPIWINNSNEIEFQFFVSSISFLNKKDSSRKKKKITFHFYCHFTRTSHKLFWKISLIILELKENHKLPRRKSIRIPLFYDLVYGNPYPVTYWKSFDLEQEMNLKVIFKKSVFGNNRKLRQILWRSINNKNDEDFKLLWTSPLVVFSLKM